MNEANLARVEDTLIGPKILVPPDKGLHHWFEDQVRRTPHDLAIVAERNLTYEQLDHEANLLANRLIEIGSAPDKLVIVYLPRSAMALVAILGILKSGAAYLAIDITAPKARATDLLADAKACAIVTEKSRLETLPAASVPVFLLDDEGDDAVAPSPCPAVKISGSNLAYVISTSGTTGRPKLIGVEHRQVSNLLAFATQTLIQPDDFRWVPFIDAPSFDSSISQIFVTLSLGGTLVLVEDILEIQDSVYYNKFTCFGTTPSRLAFILEQRGLPPAVQLIGLGAEAIPGALLQKLDELPQIKKVINYYGPTEATVYCTVSMVLDRAGPGDAVALRDRGRIIGHPIANTRIYLVDDLGQLVPPGAPGEIYIAGASVARGYLSYAGKAAENFLPDRFTRDKNARMYRSGDIGRRRADGQLEFHGRKDHQLKFHGVRIEAAEVENALMKFPGVHQAVVDVRLDSEGKKRLVAYVKIDEVDLSKKQLKKVLRLVLPGAMIPQHFVILRSMPLTTNGKVDREALSRLEIGLLPVSDPDSPATPAEKEMRKLWEQNLARRPLGLDQDYFELGGDSLSAVNLLLAIEQHFGVRLKPQILLESSTISELAREVESAPGAALSPTAPRIDESVLLPLQPSGNLTPLILIAGESGASFLSYKDFAQNFFPNHPVYALPSPYAAMLHENADPVSFLSGHFAQKILNAVHGRSFVLFGHCVGGLLAWHLASALEKLDAPPFKLVVYDTPIPRRGGNVAPGSPPFARKSRLGNISDAYRTAWNDWLTSHDQTWQSRLGFFWWASNNVLMRRGLDRSEQGRQSFAKLAYLRALQSRPLTRYGGDALLLYHYAQKRMVSRSLWHAHSTAQTHFEFVAGDHADWEGAIQNACPSIRHQLELLDDQAQAIIQNGHAPGPEAHSAVIC